MRTSIRLLLMVATTGMLLAAILSCGGSVEQGPMVVPPKAEIPDDQKRPTARVSSPMLDGLISELEWADADEFQTGWEDGTIWVKPESLSIYICIASADTGHTGLDLYIDNLKGRVFMLHVSSAHGNRELVDSAWQEMDWGSNGFWTSNLIESVFKDGQRVYLIPEAFEYQISRELLPAAGFKFLAHLKRPDRWFPENADTLSSENWIWYTPEVGSD